MNIYKELDYKKILKSSVTKRGTSFKALAEAAGVQPPYLSRVFRHSDHLNHEQLFLICRQLNLIGDEYQYLVLLLAYERAGNHRYKKFVSLQIEEFRREKLKLQKQIEDRGMKTRRLDVEQANLVSYYLDSNLQIIHMAMLIRKYSQNPLLLAKVLGVEESQIKFCLSKLQTLGLINRKDKKWTVEDKFLHLDKDDVLSEQNHLNWRIKAMQYTKVNSRKKYSYTATMCASKEFFEKAEAAIKSIVTDMSKNAIEGNSEQVFQVNFDLISLA